MPANFCELELRLSWLDVGRYSIGARFVDADNDLQNDIIEAVEIAIDLDRLRALWLDEAGYGAALSAMVFGTPGEPMHRAYQRAADLAGQRHLRIRLNILPSAPELHALRWELMHVPGRAMAWFAQPGVWFSRFLSAEDFRLRPASGQNELEVLVVIANPSDLATRWRQPELDAEAEYARAVQAVADGSDGGGRKMRVRRLQGRATVFNLVSSLRTSYADVLYLICHGTLTEDGEARLLLEAEDGRGEIVRGEQLVERLSSIQERPRLVVLASCQSASQHDGAALSAIGPRLAQAGIPGVLAMQGDITLASVARFMPRLFRELALDGQVDRAVAEARLTLVDRHDWWMPVLYTRSRTGCLWPARAVPVESFDNWEGIATDLKEQLCVPVLGPGLVESTFGSTRELARRWAQFYEFPLAPRNRDDLAQVAQYLSYRHSPAHVLDELREYLTRHIQTRFAADLPAAMQRGMPVKLEELVKHVGSLQRQRPRNQDVHRLLARLPAKLYVNANRDNLLHDALVAAGRRPRVQLCTWRWVNGMPFPIGPRLPRDYEPSVPEPLIFHVFGNLDYRPSLVVTEDDYFEFLGSVARTEGLRKSCVPNVVTSALASSGLLLLGFQADDWAFRVLFSSILKQPGNPMADMRTRVAIQMEPVEGRIIDPERTLSYLRKYFERQARISVFWGSADDFMQRLCTKLEDRHLFVGVPSPEPVLEDV
jgi:hypothetical protein